MSCGMLSGSSNTRVQPYPKHPHLHLSNTRRIVVVLVLGGSFKHTHLSLKQRRNPGLCSSSFRPRAAVKEDGSPLPQTEAERRSFYELLGISESGSYSEIKRAYKQMSRKYHPDVSPPDRTEEYTRRFIEVQEAYETLSDPRRKAIYDRDLARGLHLAFSTRRRFSEELEERPEWRNRWQDQIAELKKKSTQKDSGENLSWAARMRRQRTESSAE